MSHPRIISGKARGVRLQPVPGEITRPITDRVKEALFNIINGDVIDSRFLDLFAGTGSVGLEALSRGAAYVRFVDINRVAINTLKMNICHTRLDNGSEIMRADAFNILSQIPDCQFDYIYVAPPQYKNLWERALLSLDNNPGWLSPDGWIVVQIDPIEYIESKFLSFFEFDQRRYGSTLLVFYKHILIETGDQVA
jgi:16S rRNA (guanine966-N2)-methyltransferase